MAVFNKGAVIINSVQYKGVWKLTCVCGQPTFYEECGLCCTEINDNSFVNNISVHVTLEQTIADIKAFTENIQMHAQIFVRVEIFLFLQIQGILEYIIYCF